MRDANGHGSDPTIPEDVADRLEHAFQVGAVNKDAAAYAGVKLRTLEYWLTQGRRGVEPYKQLTDRLDEARGAGNIHSLDVLQTSTDWRAHRARLAFQDKGYVERRFVEGRVEHRHTLDLSRVPVDRLETFLAILEEMGVPRGDVIEDAEVLELEPSQDTT